METKASAAVMRMRSNISNAPMKSTLAHNCDFFIVQIAWFKVCINLSDLQYVVVVENYLFCFVLFDL